MAGDKTENAASGVAYKKIIHGWGEGEAALGKSLELIPTLNSYLFVSLIKQEYVDWVEAEEEQE